MSATAGLLVASGAIVRPWFAQGQPAAAPSSFRPGVTRVWRIDGRATERTGPRLPPPADAGEDRDRADQAARQPARPGARLFARRRRGLPRDRGRSRPRPRASPRAAISSRSSPTARPCSASAPSARSPAKPVMEGKAVPLQEIRRHRRLRHRDRRARSRQARRHHRRARADLRRHQSRGHQGAGMLRRSSASCAQRMKIPVFHDDQHGTAIIVGAAVCNGARARRQAHRAR